jgi:acyl-CoA synthetase (NDP forming)/GNAT superfamily N-acetyltransferase
VDLEPESRDLHNPVGSEADAGCEALAATGAVVRIRPVRPDDADAIRALHDRTSAENLYLRFFAQSRTAAEQEVARLVRRDDADHAVLVALLGGVLIGVASFERTSADEAEVALLVDERHQGEGIGTLLLEHAASAARRRGIARLVGETLVQNRRMLDVFRHSGLEDGRSLGAGVIDVHLATEPDAQALEASDERERLAELRSLGPLFSPRSVAVVGAGRSGGIGHEVLRSLLRGGFTGPIYPINPNTSAVEGVPAYASVGAVGRAVDLAVVAVPPAAVDSVVADCGTSGVRVVVVLTSYPPDIGDPEDPPSRRSLLRVARQHGVRVVGPNCLGVVSTDPAVRLDASFARDTPGPGGIALGSQSGAVGIAALERVTESGAGVAVFVSLGDKIDISGNDLLLLWDRDPRVSVIALYLESVGNPRKFARLARRITEHKPVVLLKSGRSAGGQRAGLSHTASATTSDVMVDVLCQQAGITRVDTLEELIEVSTLPDDQPLPAGGRIAVVGNAGGAGVLAADAAQQAGLEVPELSADLQAELKRLLPTAAVANPVDLGAAAGPEAFQTAITAVAGSGEVDALITVFAATAVGTPKQVLSMLNQAAGTSPLPVLATLFGVRSDDRPPGRGEARRLPVFASPEPAVRALAHAVRYARWRQTARGHLLEIDPGEVARAKKLIAEFLEQAPGGGWPDASWITTILGCYGVEIVPTLVAGSADAAISAADQVGYPVAVKTAAPGVHKTDIGGVRINIGSAAELRSAYQEIKTSTDVPEVIVQPMVVDAVAELVVGIVAEASFGPILMVGLGGIATDLLDDRAFRAAPVTDAEAWQMVLGLRAAPLLLGHRGKAPVDLDGLLELLQRVGQLAADHPEVAELDLNPVLVRADRAVAVDVRLRIAPVPDAPDPDLRRLRA